MNLFQLFSTFFGMIATWISAVERIANASDKYCEIAEKHAEVTLDQYTLEAAARTEKLKQQLQALEAQTSTKVEL